MKKDPLEKAVEDVVNSKAFQDYAKAAGLPESFKARKEWVLNAMKPSESPPPEPEVKK